MCLVVFSYKKHLNYKLIIAANRDEFYHRPTQPADFWHDSPNLLGGRDLEANGTWMGVTTEGKVSLLTNYRDLRNLKQNTPSRGHLVSDFLKQEELPKTYLEKLHNISDTYNGFNLVVGNQDDLWYYSNENKRITMLGSGLYGLSNALIDTPWPKLIRAKNKIGDAFNDDFINADKVLDALFDDLRASDDQLPDTGIGFEKEKMLSSIFIKSPDYGTRCSTLVTVDQNDNLNFHERTYDLKTFAYSTRLFEFRLNSRVRG
ncbi:MAG TPA: NRDE family protein [Cyclobacteriaceae bacterium]|jgi:uncharacterized protein with NRDE domain